jgi:adenosylmethionine-8-amino-7-oxononanoate aminotransferase
MTHVFYRSSLSHPPIAARASGMTITDRSGKVYIDASGGAAVSCLGHGHPEIVRAVKLQIDTLDYAHTAFFTSEPAEALADELIAEAPAGLERVYFVSGGSEAMEAALKLTRQYFLEIGQPKRHRFVSRRQSYHGNTLGALAVGGNVWRREPYAPLLMDVSLVAPCYAYRYRRDDESEFAYGSRVADELEQEILRLGPENVAAFVAETVVGATSGAVTAVPGYFKRVREICDRYGVLLILDEVMCGMGRTGSLHACTQEGIAPDIMTIAKGLGGGYQPIGAMLASSKVFDAVARGSGSFMHGHTYMGHSIACAASLAVLRTIRKDRLVERVAELGTLLSSRLRERFGAHEFVGDIRGRGLFQAIELVADRASKAPFATERRLHARIKQEAMQRGLIVYPSGGTADGRAGDHVLLAPPYIATSGDIDTIIERLAEAVDAAIAESI